MKVNSRHCFGKLRLISMVAVLSTIVGASALVQGSVGYVSAPSSAYPEALVRQRRQNLAPTCQGDANNQLPFNTFDSAHPMPSAGNNCSPNQSPNQGPPPTLQNIQPGQLCPNPPAQFPLNGPSGPDQALCKPCPGLAPGDPLKAADACKWCSSVGISREIE